MMTVYPNYYPRFACIAEKCRHNCCIGWEIDIDEATLAYYGALKGEMGERLSRFICKTDGGACFVLDENERCPFLNQKGLCDIILTLGEDALSDICTDHPRYRHFFSGRTELGLGLCCESAARLVLSMREKMHLVEAPSEEDMENSCTSAEKDFFREREALLAIAQDRALSLDERMQTLLNKAGVVYPTKDYDEWAELYRSLERMEESFETVVEKIASLSSCATSDVADEILFEQLLVYFLYRHYTPENGDAAVGFSVHATCLLRALACSAALGFEEITDLCRIYSAEIEYSEENTEALLSLFDAQTQ